VLTDGTHAIYLDTVAGRRFSKIIGKVAATSVTVEDTITAANCTNRSWAIGGKLRYLWADTGYRRLLDDGSSSGDAKPGWIIEFVDGHSETTSTSEVRIGGDTTDGKLTVRGESEASVRPSITTSATWGLMIRQPSLIFRDFDVTQSSSGNYVIRSFAGGDNLFLNLKVSCSHASKASDGIACQANDVVSGCEIDNAVNGIYGHAEVTVYNSYVYDCTTGINSTTCISVQLLGNVVVDCTTGIVAGSATRVSTIANNVIDTCTTGILYDELATTSVAPWANNIIVNCTTGIHWSNASMTQKYLDAQWMGKVLGNCLWNNTTHMKANATSLTVTDFIDCFVASAEPFSVTTKASRKTAGNWTGNTEVRAAGFPQDNCGFLAATRNYVDCGIQREEPAGLALVNARRNTLIGR
jgi:hypothetical protein